MRRVMICLILLSVSVLTYAQEENITQELDTDLDAAFQGNRSNSTMNQNASWNLTAQDTFIGGYDGEIAAIEQEFNRYTASLSQEDCDRALEELHLKFMESLRGIPNAQIFSGIPPRYQ